MPGPGCRGRRWRPSSVPRRGICVSERCSCLPPAAQHASAGLARIGTFREPAAPLTVVNRPKRVSYSRMQQDQDFWSKILMIAVAFLIAAWVMFAWTMSTGLTWAGGRSNTQGRIANEQDRLRVKHIAVM